MGGSVVHYVSCGASVQSTMSRRADYRDASKRHGDPQICPRRDMMDYIDDPKGDDGPRCHQEAYWTLEMPSTDSWSRDAPKK